MNQNQAKDIQQTTTEQEKIIADIGGRKAGMLPLQDTTTTVKIDLQGLNLNKADYEKFRALVMIPKEKQDQFLADVINDMLHHLLYENPDLFNSYVR